MERKQHPVKKIPHRGSAAFFGLIVVFCLLAGCNSGGGSDPIPVSSKGTASGKLIVPPDHTVEVEPNDTAAQAQAILDAASISGAAFEGDPGFATQAPDSIEIQDLYRLSAAGPVRIILSIADDRVGDDDKLINDLDLFLLDAEGEQVLDASEGFVSTEFIETKNSGEFLIGVRAFTGSSAYLLNLSSIGTLSALKSEILPPGAEWVPDELLVKRREIPGGRQKAAAFEARHGLLHKGSFPEGVDLVAFSPPAAHFRKGEIGAKKKVHLPGSEANADKARMWDKISKLRSDPEVVYAEPNFIRRLSADPTDPNYRLQWHYSLINLPGAWDVTVGSDTVVVAVIDSGALYNHPDLNHPDLGPRLIPGFDFISNPANAGDQQGGINATDIDSDATDVGDDPEHQSSSFHGTHVAGTIGAQTNNAGVAGITWETRIMPLRVCGTIGCADADIAQAIRYAAGLSNSSGTLPAQKADIINMSLGGEGFSQTQQNAITAARNADVIVVAAAGNENAGTFTSPASLDGVISVAAVDINSKKTPYSNYGPHVDVAAPGGDGSADLNGDGFPDGILSTWAEEVPNPNDPTLPPTLRYGFRFMQGTSMAAPHVSGVLALMLAVNPGLKPQQIDALLAGSHSGTHIRITRDLGSPGRDDLYGHGLIDASQAVIAARAVPGATGGIEPAGSILAVSNLSLDFSNFIDALELDLSNAGIGTLNVTDVSDDAPWLTVTPASGEAPLTLQVTVDRSGLAPGAYSAAITIVSDAARNTTATVPVKMKVGGATSGNVGTLIVLVVDKDTLKTVAETEATAEEGYAYATPEMTPGTYLVVAGTDRDNDRFICDVEDACGVYPDLIAVAAGEERTDIDFIVGELVSPQSAESTAGPLRGKKFKRLE